MDGYFLFLIIAIATILSPGPGVILTLTNAIRFGVTGAIGGILGIAFGTFIVAGVSATSLGILLVSSTIAFNIMKFVGAAYLIYLGIKLWRSPAVNIDSQNTAMTSKKRQFMQGFSIQLTNPKAVFFFMSIFPQFVDFKSDYVNHFTLLVVTYSSLVVIIHLLYAHLAKSIRNWLSSVKGGRTVNRLGGGAFVFFGVGVASAGK